MKKIVLSVVAATTLAVALPAAAQGYRGQGYGPPAHAPAHGYRGQEQGWVSMQSRVDRLNERIERGLQNGRLTRNEARRLRAQLNGLVQLEYRYRQGGLNGWERQDLDRRFEALSAQIRWERRDDDRRY